MVAIVIKNHCNGKYREEDITMFDSDYHSGYYCHHLLHNIQKKAIETRARSICYPHLPTSHPARQLYFPLWVLTYWKETSLLRMHVIGPWS